MGNNSDTGHIYQALGTNALIALAKGVAAFYTGSGALLAETLHTAADCGNQLLLLLGVKSAQRPASTAHPLGYGRALYFWSFIVALILFAGGGVFSIMEGLHKFEHPEPISLPYVGIAILLFSLALEGYSTYSNLIEMKKRRGSLSLGKYLRETKDSDLVVVFGENSAATLGLLVAIVAVLIAWISGNPWWDALGSLVIGVILVGVALFLAVEVKSLLVGESADAKIAGAVQTILQRHPNVTGLLHLITMQQGPSQVLIMMKLGFKPDLQVGAVCDEINNFEDELRIVCPEVRWCFIEPDRPRK